jgi:hypothetical protein
MNKILQGTSTLKKAMKSMRVRRTMTGSMEKVMRGMNMSIMSMKERNRNTMGISMVKKGNMNMILKSMDMKEITIRVIMEMEILRPTLK